MNPQDALAYGTPNYGTTYSPFDSSRYYNQDAQLYYEQIRAQGFQQIQDDTVLRESRTIRQKVSLTKMVAHAARRPEAIAYARYNQMGAAYADDRAERIMGGAAAIGSGVKNIGSLAALLLGGPLGSAAYEGTMAAAGFAGIGGAFTQFKEANEIRGMSSQFMAGQAGQVGTNRMSRGSAQQIAGYLAKTDRLSLVMKDGENLASLKDKMATLSENRLLDGVKNAEDFVVRFGKLRESVKKMTELYGKSFEESAAMLGEFRNLGVGATSAQYAIQRGMTGAAQFGVGFDQSYAAGMKGAMAVQGTGLTAEAGFAMGSRAEGSGQVMYQSGLLDSKTIFNLGGPDNLGTSIQRAQMRFLESTAYTAALMSSTSSETGTNFGVLADTMTGKRGLAENVTGVAANVNDLGSLVAHRARASTLTSELLEQNPAAASAMAVSNLLQLAPTLGLDPKTMTKAELAQLAPTIYPGMTPDEMKALMADVEAAATGQGRVGLRDLGIDESRAKDQIGLGPVDQVLRFARSNALVGGVVTGSARLGSDFRSGGAEMQRDIADFVNETFYDQTTIRTTADAVKSQRNIAAQLEFDGEGRRYEDSESPFRAEQAADVYQMKHRQGTLGAAVVQGTAGRFEHTDSSGKKAPEQGVSFSIEEAETLGLNVTAEEVRNGRGYSNSKLRDLGITYIEDVGYVRQSELDQQEVADREMADVITAARESYDPRTMTAASVKKATAASIAIAEVFESDDSGGDGFFSRIGQTKIERMMAESDGDGMAEMAAVVQREIATTLGIDTSVEGFQAKLTEAMKTEEGKQVTGNVLAAMERNESIGAENVRRFEGYVALGIDPVKAKQQTDDALTQFAVLTDKAAGDMFGRHGSNSAGVRKGATLIDGMSRNARVEFYAETAEYLAEGTTAERKAELDAEAATGMSQPLLAFRQGIIDGTDEFTKGIQTSLRDEATMRNFTAEREAIPEGDLGTGDVDVSTGGVQMQQGKADREAQKIIEEALNTVADTLRMINDSQASLNRQINSNSAISINFG